MPPPSRANNYGPNNMHAPPGAFSNQQGGGLHLPHSGILERERFQQQQQHQQQQHHQHHPAFLAQAQAAQVQAQQAQAQQAQAQRNQQAQQQQQQQQQQHSQQEKNLLGILSARGVNGAVGVGVGGAVSAAGLGGVVGRGMGTAVPERTPAASGDGVIRDVWETNLEREMAILRDLVDRYPYISMDTEFPGIVARPIGKFPSKADYHYQTLRCNVDMLKIIQLGITLADENGEFAKVDGSVSTWQFHFRFHLEADMYAQDSIELLTKSGIDFTKNSTQGIDVQKFGELLITSGLVMLDEVKWISFHSGYDFGYLVKVMSCTLLPKEETEFREKLRKFFPALYDIKYLMKSCRTLKGGLQEIADDLGIQRIGPQHQAGSDSLLTGQIFFQMRSRFFDGKIEDDKYLGQVWGLNGAGMGAPGTNGMFTVTAGGPLPPSTPSNAPNGTPGPQQTPDHNGRQTPGTPGGYTPGFGKMGMQ